MASTILFKRSNTAGNDSYTGFLGEVTVDTQARKLRIHDGIKVGGHVVSNMADLNAVINSVDNLAIADISGLEAAFTTIDQRLDTLELNSIKKDGSVAFTGNINAGNHQIKNVAYPELATDGANKKYVDDEISALGSVFSYEGSIDGGTEFSPYDLDQLSVTSAGAYYTVSTSGYIVRNTIKSYVNVNDSVIFDNVGNYKVIDNSNSEISGTLDYINVTGNPDTGYTVDIDPTLKNRITTLEGGSLVGITGNAPIVVDNTDAQNPIIGINNATPTTAGAMSAADKAKLDGIETGAEANTVDSVNGYTGIVNITKTDVGLGNVDNNATATQSQATAGNSANTFMTPEGVRYFIEDGTYTVDGGTF